VTGVPQLAPRRSTDRSRLRWVAVLAVVLLGACAQLPRPGEALPYAAKPAMDSDFPDPAVVRAADGWIYAYATQTTREDRLINIQVARSRDLASWEHLGEALPEKPVWASRTQNFWAPDVVYDAEAGRYVMYYSAERDGSREFCLAVATAAVARGPYVDIGQPLLCGQGFEHIDPMAFDDPRSGRRMLYWGSGFGPIRVRELAPDRLRFEQGSIAQDLLLPGLERDYSRLVEGAWVTFRDGYYYLYYSGDNCCSGTPRYAVMVARAHSPFGPFTRLGEADGSGRSVILEADGAWLAPGHNSIHTDAAGRDWMLYHAIDPRQPTLVDQVHGRIARRVLLVEPLEYVDGWPRVARSAGAARP
jgi:arabinan endo-1,5-alpha-L-arabinosidase